MSIILWIMKEWHILPVAADVEWFGICKIEFHCALCRFCIIIITKEISIVRQAIETFKAVRWRETYIYSLKSEFKSYQKSFHGKICWFMWNWMDLIWVPYPLLRFRILQESIARDYFSSIWPTVLVNRYPQYINSWSVINLLYEEKVFCKCYDMQHVLLYVEYHCKTFIPS